MNFLSPEDILSLGAAFSAGFTVIALWWSLTDRDPRLARMKKRLAEQSQLRDTALGPKSGARTQFLAGAELSPKGLVRWVIHKLNLLKGEEANRLTLRLAQAGLRSKDHLHMCLFAKLVLPITFGAFGVLFLNFGAAEQLSPMIRLAITLGAVIFGLYLPEVWLTNLIQRRQTDLSRGLPDALDLLVICAEAGLSLDAALSRVSRELDKAQPAIADEFSLTATELGFLPDRKEALRNLAHRVNLPTVRGVVSTLQQTEKYGTPLAQSLRVLAAEFREQRVLKAEEKAARLPATLTVPLVLFILPSLFIVLIGPAIIKTIDQIGNLR